MEGLRVAAEAESVLVEKWKKFEAIAIVGGEVGGNLKEETEAAVERLGKTYMKALKKIRKSVYFGADESGFVQMWSEIESKFQDKWERAIDAYNRVVKKKEAREEIKKRKEEKKQITQIYKVITKK
jgi:hypothetical protein